MPPGKVHELAFLWFGLRAAGASHPRKQGSEEIPLGENAENAENADTRTRKMRKMLLIGFNVTGLCFANRGVGVVEIVSDLGHLTSAIARGHISCS